MTRSELIRQARKLLAFDEAIAKLQEAGLEEEFISAIEKDPELLKALDQMAPHITAAASPGWSCCVTVSNPLPMAEYRVA
jgi:hypothetical protein